MRIRPLVALVALVVGSGVFAQTAESPATAPADAAETPVSEPVATPPTAEPVAPTEVSTPAPVDNAPVAAAVPEGPAHAGDPAAGEAKAAACGACHGMDGNATDPQYPKLAGQHESYIARQLALFKSGERENAVMMGFAATLSAQDMRDLGAFYATKAALPGSASDARIVPEDEETWVARGEHLFRGGNATSETPACMACHGPNGRGNPGAKYPALAGQHTDYTKAMLLKFRDEKMVWGKDENASPVMAEVVQGLSDQDLEALSSYIEGLHTQVAASAAAAPAAAPPPAAAAAAPAPAAPSAAETAPAPTAPADPATTPAATEPAPAAEEPAQDPVAPAQ